MEASKSCDWLPGYELAVGLREQLVESRFGWPIKPLCTGLILVVSVVKSVHLEVQCRVCPVLPWSYLKKFYMMVDDGSYSLLKSSPVVGVTALVWEQVSFTLTKSI